jgi:hypothetical protein
MDAPDIVKNTDRSHMFIVSRNAPRIHSHPETVSSEKSSGNGATEETTAVADAAGDADKTETPPTGPKPPSDDTFAPENVVRVITVGLEFGMFREEDVCDELAAIAGTEIGAGNDVGIAGKVGFDSSAAVGFVGFDGLTIVAPLFIKLLKISKSEAKLPFVAASALSETYHVPAVTPV